MAGFQVAINGRFWVATEVLSTHPEYLSAMLKELESVGLIRRDDTGIVIPDRTKLWHRELL